ncbi:hypothetical protein B9Z19DRAFT_1127125 [Tuber borchii]|uniref:Nephrocystin 3-like N-terminal domain-containing protein n=1 Tax=Tuber borchii TaxID=42251 RepID=A0A2T6ZS14_TUBBO|nr:hypothetical protein B9Z19DRAFT_1127125 [Tuber borchii]
MATNLTATGENVKSEETSAGLEESAPPLLYSAKKQWRTLQTFLKQERRMDPTKAGQDIIELNTLEAQGAKDVDQQGPHPKGGKPAKHPKQQHSKPMGDLPQSKEKSEMPTQDQKKNGNLNPKGESPDKDEKPESLHSLLNPIIDKTLFKGHREQFKAALETYLCKYEGATKTQVWESMTLSNILKKAQAAEEKYKKSSVIRGWLRKFAKELPLLKPWLGLLPATLFPYTNVLMGGLKIMLDAAAKVQDGREKIVKILGEIPGIIGRGQVFAEIYQSSPRVQERSEQLYIVMLDVFEHVLIWLTRKAATNFLGAMFFGELYLKGLERKFSKFRGVAETLREEANPCLHQVVREMNVSLMQGGGMEKLVSANEEIVEYVVKTYDATKIQVEMLTNISKMVAQLSKDSPKSQSYSKMDQATNTTPMTDITFSSDIISWRACKSEYLKAFAIAIRISLQNGYQQSLIDFNLIDWIMNSPQMKTWLTTASGILFIKGNRENMPVSTLSYLAAMMLQEIAESDTPVLHFFCGDNANKSAGPSGLIRSLVVQLLASSLLDPTTAPILQISKDIPDETEALCILFRQLIDQFSYPRLLFIIIDGISHFEDENKLEETCLILQHLQEITQHAIATIKVLIMAPCETKFAELLQGAVGGRDTERMGELDKDSRLEVLHALVYLEHERGQRIGREVSYWNERYSESLPDQERGAAWWEMEEPEDNCRGRLAPKISRRRAISL